MTELYELRLLKQDIANGADDTSPEEMARLRELNAQ